MKQAIYELIENAVSAGNTLPEDFSLPQEPDGGITWADGAMDGVYLYHTAHEEPSKEQLQLMAEAVWAVSLGSDERADELFLQLSASVQPIAFIDALQEFVIENKENLPNQMVFAYALRCMMKSSEKDLVKVGLILMELFGVDSDDDVAPVIRTLALSDEFTVFCLYIMGRWKNGNEEIFGLARSVRGWGRIHAVERLEANSDDVRFWLMTEGVHNNVIPAYSARKCWEASGAARRLKGLPAAEGSSIKGPLTARELAGIRDILDALFDEGPVAGISVIEGADEALRDFLMAVKQYKIGPQEYDLIDSIRKYFEDPAHKDEFTANLCTTLLR